MTSNLIPTPNTQLSSEVFTKKASLIARGLNEISLLKPSPESLYQTGMDYYEGSNGKPWDILKAYACLVKSAEQGFALAQWRLYCMFGVDKAVDNNEEKQEYWLEKSALNGHLEAMYLSLYESSETYLEELTHLAESGHRRALDEFVGHYITGDYEPKKYPALDILDGHYIICDYEFIEHIEKDMRQAWHMWLAWRWVKRSIEEGSCYGIQDKSLLENATAEFWDEVDKDNGYWLPYDWLCEERYSAAERAQYYENRMIWLIEKAQQGEAFAQLELGVELWFSENWQLVICEKRQLVICEKLLHQQAAIATGEPIDWAKLAIFWLTKPAEQGFVKAQLVLGHLYLYYIDHEKAVYWLRRAAEQGWCSYYFEAILAFNATERADAPYFTLEELENYRLTNHDSI